MRFVIPDREEYAATVILTAHMKPYLRDALDSLLDQTQFDFAAGPVQVLVVDSGQWQDRDDPTSQAMREIYTEYAGLDLFDWVFTDEGPDLRSRACPVAWATNQVIRAGLVRGRYVCTFYDDDRYHPTFLERTVGFLDAHPQHRAVWFSQNRIRLRADGTEDLVGVIPAYAAKSTGWDCQVDGGQVMFHRSVLDEIGDPWLPEDPADGSCRHSDGIFLEKMAALCAPVPAIPEILMDHRFTPISTYTPSEQAR